MTDQLDLTLIFNSVCFPFNRFMGEYTDYPADYAEVSQNGQQSPTPYATTTLIGSSKLGGNDAHRYNMFYTTDVHPPNSTVAAAGGVPSQNNNNANYNRSIHSESYCNPNGNNNSNKVNIVENRMANTMMPNMFNQRAAAKLGSNKRNRLKLMNPQNFRLNFGSQGEQLYVKVGDLSSQGQASSTAQHTPQSQNGSINWSTQNFNIYENQLHHHANGSTASNDPDKDYLYAGNRSIMSYMSSKDFPENV